MTAVTKMTEPQLRAWLLARMRGEQVEPPIDESRLESPDDYVQALVRQSKDRRFHARLNKAIIGALQEAADRLTSGPGVAAVRHLAALADGLELRAAAPILSEIASKGVFGGHHGAVDPAAEEMVLFALAGLQAPGELWSQWFALWERDAPQFWPVVTAGLRISDPKRALAILPRAVERSGVHPEFPLGEVLWAFATDAHVDVGDFAAALAKLDSRARTRCRQALEAVGAQPHELDAWLPEQSDERTVTGKAIPGGVVPWWEWPGLNLRRPPRFTDVAA